MKESLKGMVRKATTMPLTYERDVYMLYAPNTAEGQPPTHIVNRVDDRGRRDDRYLRPLITKMNRMGKKL